MITATRRIIRAAERAFESTRAYARATYFFERVALQASARPGGPSRSHLVVVASEGRGNIGDQAMLEAVVAKWHGPIVVIADHPEAVQHGWAAANVRVEVIRGVLSRRIVLRNAAARRFWGIVRGAESLVVIGADVMDGVYSPRISVLRSTIASLAASIGVDSRVVGFSWSSSATRGARDALTRAARSGARLYPRDPLSYERVDAERIGPTSLVTDVVFSSSSATDPRELSEYLSAGGRLVLINASGLIARSVDLRPDYVRIVQAIRDWGLLPVLVPHVIRQGDDDLAVLRDIREASGDAAYLIERQLSPSEIRGLAAKAEFVITGRMHLAIMSMSVGVVPLTLSTVGKVEGLYSLIQLPSLVLQPTVGFSDSVLDSLNMYRGDFGQLAETLQANLHRVRSLAEVNFDGWA